MITKGRGKSHSPEQIVKKLRDADAMLNAGKDLAVVAEKFCVSLSDDAQRGRAGKASSIQALSARGIPVRGFRESPRRSFVRSSSVDRGRC